MSSPITKIALIAGGVLSLIGSAVMWSAPKNSEGAGYNYSYFIFFWVSVFLAVKFPNPIQTVISAGLFTFIFAGYPTDSTTSLYHTDNTRITLDNTGGDTESNRKRLAGAIIGYFGALITYYALISTTSAGESVKLQKIVAIVAIVLTVIGSIILWASAPIALTNNDRGYIWGSVQAVIVLVFLYTTAAFFSNKDIMSAAMFYASFVLINIPVPYAAIHDGLSGAPFDQVTAGFVFLWFAVAATFFRGLGFSPKTGAVSTA